MNHRNKLEAIAAGCGRSGARFTSFNLSALFPKSLDFDESALQYLSCVPEATIDADFFSILSAREILSNTKNHIPCCHAFPYGFIAIAREMSGDAFALDVHTGGVFMLSHEKYENDGLHRGWNDDTTEFLPTLPYSREAIIDTAEAEWESVDEFLDTCIEQQAS
jgi:hypothetical protein